VIVSDALFAKQEPGSWSDRTICQDSAASAFSFQFATTPPAPGANECPTFTANYTVRRAGMQGAAQTAGAGTKRAGIERHWAPC
jgi:hypothetical protein